MAGFAFHTSILATLPFLMLTAEPGFLEDDLLSTIEVEAGATLYLLPELIGHLHVWHNHADKFIKVEYYMSSWETSWIYAHLPTSPEDRAPAGRLVRPEVE